MGYQDLKHLIHHNLDVMMQKKYGMLEVLNMTASDYQSVSMMFRRSKIEFVDIRSVQKRWFVIFDQTKTAINALNTVKDNQFKLKRIDINPNDVKMLANNVPKPTIN